MFAHMLEDQDDAELMSLATGQPLSTSSGIVSKQNQQQGSQQGCLNDSLLAQLTQQELDSALDTDVHLHDDWLLAQDLDKEQQRLKEEGEFKKLQVKITILCNLKGINKGYKLAPAKLKMEAMLYLINL